MKKVAISFRQINLATVFHAIQKPAALIKNILATEFNRLTIKLQL
jgi:hypothetical protein